VIGQTVSHYKILERLGEGGMGVVYRAEDIKLKRTVALKFLPQDLTRDSDAKERFIQEAQAASSLDHPNICTIHEIDETPDGQLFICMTCYAGETLKERIERGPLPIADAVDIASQIAGGLTKAHSQGIVHRDIKPDNVFLTDDNQIKIFDFGLAVLAGQTRLTRAGTTLGTVAYMSPEQTRGEDVDARSDIWALGVVLCEMIAARRPFVGEHEQAVMYSICNQDPEPLTGLRAGVPMDLEGIVGKCLEKSASDRYQSATELSVDLNRLARQLESSGAQTTRLAGAAPAARSAGRWVGIAAVVIVAAALAYAVYSRISDGEVGGAAPPAADKTMLVVLPFENLGPPDVEYFADGVTEEITSRLSALSGLGVISRTSAVHYKNVETPLRQIGEELGVDYVLEGTVRWDRPGDGESRVRVTPQLIRVADDTHLWSDRYDRVLEDIFSVQSDIATNVIAQLNITLLEPERRAVEAEPTRNMEAYQAYLRGQDYLGRSSYSIEPWRMAIEMFERAVALAPEFALAHAALSRAHSGVFNVGLEHSQLHVDKAKEAVETALALQPDLPEAHLALGYYYYHCSRDYDRALEEFEVARRALPNQDDILQHVGWIRRRQSRWDEALALHLRSLELSPLDASLWRETAGTYLYLREYDKAIEYFDRSIAISPDHVASYGMNALAFWLSTGDLAGARASLEQLPGTGGSFIDYLWFWQYVLERDFNAADSLLAASNREMFELVDMSMPSALLRGYVCELTGDDPCARESLEAARALLERELTIRPDDARVHSSLGLVHAGLGNKEDAIRAAKRALEITPVAKDAIRGARHVDHLAWVYMRVGERDRAVETLEQLLSIPSLMSVSLLRIDPRWDELRDHPGFQRLVAGSDS
jgi:TolB-like protein/Tfp pilus assembly protein PilF